MTTFLTSLANLYKYTQVDLERIMSMSSLFHHRKKVKENAESQFDVLESEKTTLSRSVEEARADRDEAIAMVDSLKSECERQIRMANEEADERMARAMIERNEAMKSLEKEKGELKAAKESIRKEAYESTKEDATREILKYGLSFSCSAIFMIK